MTRSINVNVKVKWSRYRPGVAQRVGRGIALLFHDRGIRRGELSASRPGRILPPGKTRYPLYRRLGGPQGRYGRAENLVPTGIRSLTVQPVVSHYTDWATRTTEYQCTFIYSLFNLSNEIIMENARALKTSCKSYQRIPGNFETTTCYLPSSYVFN